MSGLHKHGHKLLIFLIVVILVAAIFLVVNEVPTPSKNKFYPKPVLTFSKMPCEDKNENSLCIPSEVPSEKARKT